MDSGSRYEALLHAPLREEPFASVPSSPRQFTELELQAHWFAGDFGREFVTVSGDRVRVVQFGTWNREAGPDFAEAAISLNDGEARSGAIELDPDARDWERHGHASNPAYESVVLHVFTRVGGDEFFTRTAKHRNVPQVRIDVSQLDAVAPPNAQAAAREGRCAGPLRALSEDKVRDVLLGAARFRLQRKSAALARLTEAHGANEALYQSLAATLGYKNNKFPFALLAQRLPLRLLRQGGVADALLFGVSGFLPSKDLGPFDSSTRNYLRELWEKWWPRRAEFERLTLDPGLWKLSGQRPANHPQRRLAALAQIVEHWPKVRSLARNCEPRAIQEFFGKLSDDYWDFHYTVTSKASAQRMALVGESRVIEMLANVFYPLALGRDEKRWVGFKNLSAPLTNRRVEIAALRLFGTSDLARSLLRDVAMQQGLLQIYEDFCMRDASDCERCQFPRQLAKW